MSTEQTTEKSTHARDSHSDPLSALVRIFLNSNLSVILIVFSILTGIAALWITPREEDPQIVVPLADIYVSFPGHDAAEVEQLVSTPLERMLYQIDGVEYVYSMSRDNASIITVRFYVGQDRERSLVKLFKKLDENAERIPRGVTNWIMKPVEIDDVPIVTFALTGAEHNSHALRRIAEELVERLSVVPQVSRAYVVGGESRTISVSLDPERMHAANVSSTEAIRAVSAANHASPAGIYERGNEMLQVVTSANLSSATQLGNVVVGVSDNHPVYLKDIAKLTDGPAETTTYTRHGWGQASQWHLHPSTPGNVLGSHANTANTTHDTIDRLSQPAVTIAIAKQKGANAVTVAENIVREAERLQESLLPNDVKLVVTRNSGIAANEKVNELVEALGVAIVIVVLLLTVGLGWREALIVSVAVPVVFGLTLAVNLLFGYTINRVTLFALILALGLLVDDPIVDVENIARHFEHHKRASRRIVLEAVAEIRPPLISATLAVIVSFLPMFFITGMMGPYMSPMALNVPVAMLMSMLVAFTITPWLTYQVLKWHFPHSEIEPIENSKDTNQAKPSSSLEQSQSAYDPSSIQKTRLYRFFRPVMLPLLRTRLRAVAFLSLVAVLTFAAMGLGALRVVPLKMLPFDNKNELLILLDMPEHSTIEQTDSVISKLEKVLQEQPETINYVTNVGVPGPIDFNGLVRHYYLRTEPHQGEIRVNFVGKKQRKLQSHGLALKMHDTLEKLAAEAGGTLHVVELPPGPPVLSSLVAEVYGSDSHSYSELLDAGSTIASRLKKEPGVVEVDDIREDTVRRVTFVPDQEKAALAGISVEEISNTLRIALAGDRSQFLRAEGERTPLPITFQLPQSLRSSSESLAQLAVKGTTGKLVLLSELGKWKEERASQTIYHKNLQRVVYVFAECAGRTPAECIVDVLVDQTIGNDNRVAENAARPLGNRTFLFSGGGIPWNLADGLHVTFSGEGEWKITLDVFRDLGLAFAAAMLMIYILLVAQTGSFLVPLVVMLAIPLTTLGVMPGFYLLNLVMSQNIEGYADPVFFTATAMIGMIALSGIVTRDSIILVDFMQQAVASGRPLVDAILESRVVRLRPILLTAGAAMFSAVPITLDPIFSGLGWSLIFGLIASTVFTLFVIPVTYWLLYAKPVEPTKPSRQRSSGGRLPPVVGD